MKFQDFINKGLVKKSSKDISLIKSLVTTADNDIKFLKDLKLTEFSVRKITVNYYDVLRSILEAMASLEGYKIYSHEAYTFFLKEKGESLIAEKFDRFRRIRNSINYYGKTISIEEANENILEIEKLVNILRSKYFKEIK